MEESNNHTLGSTEGQIIYKLGSLEALVSTSMRRIDEAITSLRTDLNASKHETSRDVQDLSSRIKLLEEWKTSVVARIGIVMSLIVVAWAVFGSAIETTLGKIF